MTRPPSLEASPARASPLTTVDDPPSSSVLMSFMPVTLPYAGRARKRPPGKSSGRHARPDPGEQHAADDLGDTPDDRGDRDAGGRRVDRQRDADGERDVLDPDLHRHGAPLGGGQSNQPAEPPAERDAGDQRGGDRDERLGGV